MWAGAGAGAGASVADTKCWPGRDPGLSTHGRAAGRSTRWASRIVPMVSDGRSQSLAVDRAMSLRPEPVVLDEALPGLAPKIVTEVFMMADDGITTLLVEQNMQMGLKHSDHGGVPDPGKTMCGGSAGDVAEDLRILENSGAGLPVRAPPPAHRAPQWSLPVKGNDTLRGIQKLGNPMCWVPSQKSFRVFLDYRDLES